MITHTTKRKERTLESHSFILISYLLFDEYGVDNCKIELIETYPCNSIDEIRQREAHYIQTIPNINNYHNWTPERIEDRKQKERKQAKELYDKNKTKLMEKGKLYREEHREELFEKGKLYREEHRDELREKARAKYQLKKEKQIEVIEESN